MQNSALDRITAVIRGEMARLRTDADTSFAWVVQFATEANKLFGQWTFVIGEGEVGKVLSFYLDRESKRPSLRDRYKVDDSGRFERTREYDDGSGTWSVGGVVYSCTADEFTGAMATHLGRVLRAQTHQTEEAIALAGRVCKPIIEVYRPPWDMIKWEARLARDPRIKEHGEDEEMAIRALLISLDSYGSSGKRENYTVVLLPRPNRRERNPN